MSDSDKLSHYDDAGEARMVDVSPKEATKRTARAHAFVRMSPTVIAGLAANPKGDPLEVARVAGIMAAKRTHELIPMCHPLPLTFVDVQLKVKSNGVSILAEARTAGQTGVEMEALTAVAVAGLTIYDMLKAVDKTMVIGEIGLVEKRGGKSGHWRRTR